MAENPFQFQQQIKHNAQELGDFLRELSKWEGDIKRKDEELKRTAEIDKVNEKGYSYLILNFILNFIHTLSSLNFFYTHTYKIIC